MADKPKIFKVDGNKVRYTENYNLFRELDGNRSVMHQRIEGLKNSIRQYGYIGNPIVVNENHEIIDGQGRFNALRELEMQIPYIVVPGIGIKECRAMNINMKNWAISDYIDSYATESVDYKYLQILSKRFRFNVDTIVSAIIKKPYGNRTASDQVRNGKFTCTEEQYQDAIDILTFLEGLKPYVEKLNGRSREVYIALIMCYQIDEIDNEKMLTQFAKYYNIAQPITNIKQAVEAVETIYNYRQRGHAYISMLYDKITHGGI